MHNATLIAGMCVLLAGSAAAGESVPMPEKVAAKAAVGIKKPSAMDLIAEEERWVFRAGVGRPDIFIDLESLMQAQQKAKNKEAEVKRNPSGRGLDQPQGGNNDVEQLLAWGRSEDARVRQLVAARKYEDAMRASDSALKVLEPFLSKPEVAAIIVSIRTYRAQAEEAKIRDDAQAAFEALKIRVLGVLWSQDGQRMTIVDGENRALSVNDRVKDCVVINIDQDRVDFRFVFGRRRFEFPVYVDQSRSTP